LGWSADGAIAADLGASTGGFVDVLLHYGADLVYAVDVGQGQLHWKLRTDPRVKILDRLNARFLTRNHITQPVDFVTCDASFISLKTILPPCLDLTADQARLLALIKPQFEVGRESVGKGGIVRDKEAQNQACQSIVSWIDASPDWNVVDLFPSPITGTNGNHEFLVAARKAHTNSKR